MNTRNKKQLHDKVVPEQILMGKELPLDVYAKNGLLLLSKGHFVLSDRQREKLLEMGYAVDGNKLDAVSLPEADPMMVRESVLHEMAFLQQRTRTLLNYALQLEDFPRKVSLLVRDIVRLSEQHPDGVIASLLLVPFNEYGPAHALHTTALLALLSRRIPHLSSEQRHTVLAAALTMNMSICQLQNTLYHQQEALTPQQEEEIAGHPLMSSAILREAGVSDELWHWLVQTHHESWLGNGYPYGLARGEIESLAHILHMADITCAKLTPRSYRAGMVPAAALGHLFQRKNTEFDPAYTTLLIKELGIYPPGSFVRLANDEIGVVLARREKASEPQVAAIRRGDGPAYIDALIRDTSLPAHKVISPCPAAVAGVRASHLARLWRNKPATSI